MWKERTESSHRVKKKMTEGMLGVYRVEEGAEEIILYQIRVSNACVRQYHRRVRHESSRSETENELLTKTKDGM